jgi:hypothetical protein
MKHSDKKQWMPLLNRPPAAALTLAGHYAHLRIPNTSGAGSLSNGNEATGNKLGNVQRFRMDESGEFTDYLRIF